MKMLTIFANDQFAYEVDRDKTFTDEQLSFLDDMDRSMDRGIKLYGELIPQPDSQQRASFVSMNLLKALQQENEAIASASGAYMVSRYPDLAEVHAKDEGGRVVIELVKESVN